MAYGEDQLVEAALILLPYATEDDMSYFFSAILPNLDALGWHVVGM